jgi:hypothetical protein
VNARRADVLRAATLPAVLACALLGAAPRVAETQGVQVREIAGSQAITGTVRCVVPSFDAYQRTLTPSDDLRATVRVTTSKNAAVAEVRVDDDGRFTVPLPFDGRYTVIAHRRGCLDRVLARVPRGSELEVAMEPFVYRDVLNARSQCGAFQPGQPVLTYVVSTYCRFGS